MHLVHHAVAGVNAQPAADAFVLQAITDVDAHGADLHAQLAVDAVAQALGARIHALGARATAFAARGVVGDDQRVLVEHGALEARIRAHVLAHLLAQEAGIAVGGQGVEGDPEDLPRPLQRHHLHRQVADGHEVAHEGEARPQRQQQPQQVLAATPGRFLQRPAAAVQAQARTAVALQPALDPHEDLGVHRLWAAEATPQAPGHGGEQEQRQGADDEQRRQVDEVLRVQQPAEDVETPLLQIEQQGLAPMDLQPGHDVEEQLRGPHQGPAPAGEQALDGTRLDLGARLVERHGMRRGLDGDGLAGRRCAAGLRGGVFVGHSGNGQASQDRLAALSNDCARAVPGTKASDWGQKHRIRCTPAKYHHISSAKSERLPQDRCESPSL